MKWIRHLAWLLVVLGAEAGWAQETGLEAGEIRVGLCDGVAVEGGGISGSSGGGFDTAAWMLGDDVVLPKIPPAEAEDAPEGKTYRDYPEWALLPKGPDLDDEAEIRDFSRLVDEGEEGHEAMLAIVRECEDPMLARRALAVLRASSGDKRAVVAELKQILADRLSRATGPEEWLMTSIAEALVVMGDERDMEVLVPMLSHPVRRVRIIGARCIGKRGGAELLDDLAQARACQSDGRVAEAIEQAAANIAARLAARDAAAEPEGAGGGRDGTDGTDGRGPG